MSHHQQVADYDFVELITDIIYILATLGAPPQLSAIVAHDYGMPTKVPLLQHMSSNYSVVIVQQETQPYKVRGMTLQARHWALSCQP